MTLLSYLQRGAFIAAFGWLSSALAQATPLPVAEPSAKEADDAEREAGKGFYSGNYHLIPALSVSTYYDNNVFRTSSGDTPNTVTEQAGSGVMRFFASMAGERRGSPEQSAASFATGVGYDQFISGDPTVRNLSGLSLGLLGKYQYKPKGKTGLLLEGDYERATTPRTIRIADTNTLVPTFRQDTARVVVATRLRPAGGALEQQIAYSGELHIFESAEFITADHFDSDLGTYTKWSFLPRTALLFQAHMGYNNFFQDINANPFGNVDSLPLRLRLGALGLIGSRIQFNADLGYGNSFHLATPGSPEDVSFSGLIGQASAKVNIADRSVVSAGYSHDFASSLFGNFIRRDQLNLSIAQAFTPRLQGTGSVAFSLDRYSNLPALDQQQPITLNRIDFPVAVQSQLNYFARKDLSVGGQVSILGDVSNFVVRDLNTGGLNEASFLVVQAGVTAVYTY